MKLIENLDNFIELIDDLVFIKDTQGVHTHCNDAFLQFISKSREEVIGKSDFDVYSNENAVQFRKDDENIFKSGKTKLYEESYLNQDASVSFFDTKKEIIYNDAGEAVGLFCIAKEITLKKEYEIIYQDNEVLLEYIAKHDDLQDVFKKILSMAESRNIDAKCSILLLNDKKENLLCASAPSLPSFYNEAINGVAIGEKVGSCGSAAFKQERVIVSDIDTHENWQAYLALTQKANLHACWSEPIFSSANEILGTFAIYSDKVKTPSDYELKLISSYAHLASIAIEKDRNNKLVKEKELQFLQQTQESNKQLRESEYKLSQLFENALVGLMYVDENRIFLKGNQHLLDILGYDNPHEMEGLSVRQFHLSNESYIAFGEANFDTLVYKKHINIEYQLRKKDGSTLWCELSGQALDESIPADLKKGVLWTIIDISERKILEEKVRDRSREIEVKNKQLEILATKDHLTGLYNRSKLDEDLKYCIRRSKRHGSVFGVIMMDIDYFKVVNDEYGHQAGDIILQEFATVLLQSSRETDAVGRWGGEEFLIIIENTDKENIMNLAEKFRRTIEHHEFSVVKNKTASFGSAVYGSGDEINTLISRVDQALYRAKNSGRNRVEFF